ncbi:MAG: phosphoglycerate kinase, partial [Candidatus Omnitrophica bacterium]|nr:phosphoglycerate kinase [Candidatus Omnitrophota bacterium]
EIKPKAKSTESESDPKGTESRKKEIEEAKEGIPTIYSLEKALKDEDRGVRYRAAKVLEKIDSQEEEKLDGSKEKEPLLRELPSIEVGDKKLASASQLDGGILSKVFRSKEEKNPSSKLRELIRNAAILKAENIVGGGAQTITFKIPGLEGYVVKIVNPFKADSKEVERIIKGYEIGAERLKGIGAETIVLRNIKGFKVEGFEVVPVTVTNVIIQEEITPQNCSKSLEDYKEYIELQHEMWRRGVFDADFSVAFIYVADFGFTQSGKPVLYDFGKLTDVKPDEIVLHYAFSSTRSILEKLGQELYNYIVKELNIKKFNDLWARDLDVNGSISSLFDGGIETIKDFNFEGKRVVIRVDHNSPAEPKFDKEGNVIQVEITDTKRIKESLPTLIYILKENPQYIVLITHFEPKVKLPTGKKEKINLSTEIVAQALKDILPQEYKEKVVFLPQSVNKEGINEEAIATIKEGKEAKIFVLENIRFAKGEKKNSKDLREQLSELADIYIIDAFGAIHRAHASLMPLTLNKGIGLLVEKEIEHLSKVFNPRHPFVAIFGGAKVEDKVDIIKSFLEIMEEGDKFLIAGAMAYTFLKAKDSQINLGNSLIEESKIDLAREILKKAEDKGIEVLLPQDHVAVTELSSNAQVITTQGKEIPQGFMGVDIGEKTIAQFKKALENAQTVIWNGPLGVFEKKQGGFIKGTESIAQILKNLASQGKDVIIGGGDTAKAVKEAGLKEEDVFISTGGGATLKFLATKGKLPVLENLKKKDERENWDGGRLKDLRKGEDLKKNYEYPRFIGWVILSWLTKDIIDEIKKLKRRLLCTMWFKKSELWRLLILLKQKTFGLFMHVFQELRLITSLLSSLVEKFMGFPTVISGWSFLRGFNRLSGERLKVTMQEIYSFWKNISSWWNKSSDLFVNFLLKFYKLFEGRLGYLSNKYVLPPSLALPIDGIKKAFFSSSFPPILSVFIIFLPFIRGKRETLSLKRSASNYENNNFDGGAILKRTSQGIKVEFSDEKISKTPSWYIAGYEFYFAKLKPFARISLNKNFSHYVKVLRGRLRKPSRGILTSQKKRSLLVEEDEIQVGEEGAIVAVFVRKGFVPQSVDNVNNLLVKSPEGAELEWKHISEMIPDDPEFATKDMYYTRPQILIEGYRFNFWYAGPYVHCGIHNHSQEPVPFKEIHLNLIGTKGGMVKYTGTTVDTEIERIILLPGEEHGPFWTVKEGKVFYGWHAWEAGEDGNLWAVFEDVKITSKDLFRDGGISERIILIKNHFPSLIRGKRETLSLKRSASNYENNNFDGGKKEKGGVKCYPYKILKLIISLYQSLKKS